jgi:hypothetical protein
MNPALLFEVVAIRADEKARICISISSPFQKPTGEWACLFELNGLEEEQEKREYFGVDGLQALVLTLFYLRSVLARLQRKGYRFCEGDETYPAGYFEAYFDIFSKRS